ncbi:GPN-loop GTPase 3 [Tyrophagus putrescentiae]|nr:GPN-loop GTPase 3 [Tyrophagus putrescentiae]
MPRYAQLVVGPAGSGKSTYISAMLSHAEASRRQMFAVNLDPAAEVFNYQPATDIRELIHVDDIMEELNYGPNGALVYAMEYLMDNLDWLTERLGTMDDDYILFDTPGQIELVSHFGLMKNFAKYLETLNFRVCVVFLLDSQFVSDLSKYFSSLMVSLITVINLELPVVNILSKVDKIPPESRRMIDELLEPSATLLDVDLPGFRSSAPPPTDASGDHEPSASTSTSTSTTASTTVGPRRTAEKFYKLSKAFATIVDDYSLHKFLPLAINNEDLLNDVLNVVDNSLQYGEDGDVAVRDFEEL